MKTALITGASSGIGLEFAKIMASQKNDVILVARSAEKLEQLASELTAAHGIKAHVIAQDLGAPDAAKMVYDQLKSKGIAVDYLINNAGFGDFGFFKDTDWTKNKQMIDVNITALTQFCQLFIPDMVARKSGKILNVASTAAFQPGPLQAVYFASKSYVLHLSEAIANELKGTGVTVTALCPGPTESEFAKVATMEDKSLFKSKKLPTSAEVAHYGYRSMMKGKTVAIHGAMNALLAQSSRFTPRNITTAIVRKIQES